MSQSPPARGSRTLVLPSLPPVDRSHRYRRPSPYRSRQHAYMLRATLRTQSSPVLSITTSRRVMRTQSAQRELFEESATPRCQLQDVRASSRSGATASTSTSLSPGFKPLGHSPTTDRVLTFLQNARERKIPVRSGKWHKEEEQYLRKLVKLFCDGVLDNVPKTASMRSWLAKMLNCCPMRISKKQTHGEKFTGKVKYSRNPDRINSMTQLEFDATADEVAALRAAFLRAWAREELTRRHSHSSDMSFEEWYCKAIVLVPTPMIARNDHITDTKKRPQPQSVAEFRQEIASNSNANTTITAHDATSKKIDQNFATVCVDATLGGMLDDMIKSTNSAVNLANGASWEDALCLSCSSDSEDDCTVESIGSGTGLPFASLPEECVGNLEFDHLSQPVAEDKIQPSTLPSAKWCTPARDSSLLRKHAAFRFEYMTSSTAPSCSSGPRHSTGQRLKGTSRDLAASANHPHWQEDSDVSYDDLTMLATDPELLSWENVPQDSWLYEALSIENGSSPLTSPGSTNSSDILYL